jgi:hypothetical protein
MTQAAKKLLEEFDALQEADRGEVFAELLRRVALAPHDLPDPDDLVSSADQNLPRARSARAVAVKAPQRGEVWLVARFGCKGPSRAGHEHPRRRRRSGASDDRSANHERARLSIRSNHLGAVPACRRFDAQNLATIPHAKLIRNLGKLSRARMVVVERATALWLGLSLAASTGE